MKAELTSIYHELWGIKDTLFERNQDTPSYEQRLHDEYVGRAIQGLLANGRNTTCEPTQIIDAARGMANALMAARKKAKEGKDPKA